MRDEASQGPQQRNTKQTLSKREGFLFIEVVSIFLIFLTLSYVCFELYKSTLVTESEIVSDCMTASNLASLDFKNLDLDILARDPNSTDVVIKSPETSLQVYKKHLKYNLGLDDDMNPKGSFNYIKSTVNITGFIVYNVWNNTDIEVWTYDPSTNSFSFEYFPNGLGSVKTPKGNVIKYTTVYSQISFKVQYFMGSFKDVSPAEDTDIAY